MNRKAKSFTAPFLQQIASRDPSGKFVSHQDRLSAAAGAVTVQPYVGYPVKNLIEFGALRIVPDEQQSGKFAPQMTGRQLMRTGLRRQQIETP